MSPLYFFILLLSSSLFYLVDTQLWWVCQVVFQLAVCAAGVFISSWRLPALIFLVLIIFFNLEWIKPGVAPPPACRDRIDQLSGVSKFDSFRFYSGADSSGKKGAAAPALVLKLIKVKMNCRGELSKRPNAEILITKPANAGGKWFSAGDRLEFKNLKPTKSGAWSLTLKGPKKLRIYNLSRQKKILARSSLFLYVQAKARYYLDEFPMALFKALATADRSSLGKDAKDKIKRLGIAHIFAISGMHVGILYLGISFILRSLISFPFVAIKKGRGALMVDIIALSLIFAFLKIIYTPISAQRAFIMLVWWTAIRHFFPWQPVSFVFLGTALLILAPQPAAAAQLSFQLSFLSVAGIILILPLLPGRRLQDSFIMSFLKITVSLAAVSLWLSFFTLPLTSKIYPHYSIASAINNIVHILYLSYIFMPLALSAFLHSAASYVFGDMIGEFYLYRLINFSGRVWERILNRSAEWSDPWLLKIDAEFDMSSMIIYWTVLALASQTLVFLLKRHKSAAAGNTEPSLSFAPRFPSNIKTTARAKIKKFLKIK